MNGLKVIETFGSDQFTRFGTINAKFFIKKTNETDENTYHLVDTIGEIYNLPAEPAEFILQDINGIQYNSLNGDELIINSKKLKPLADFFDFKADVDAGNIDPYIDFWKDKLGIEEIDLELFMLVADYVTDGKIRADKIESLALLDLIISVQTSIADFAANSGGYTFQKNDLIAVSDGSGKYSFYIYTGGVKTDVASYLAMGISNVTISQVVGLQDALTLLSNRITANETAIATKQDKSLFSNLADKWIHYYDLATAKFQPILKLVSGTVNQLEFSGRIKADAVVLPANSNPAVANRLRNDGGRLKYANASAVESDIAYTSDINATNITASINAASAAQKTSMRTALLGTATPANPVINDASPRFITRNPTYVDLYGINLTLLDPTQIWIERVDGSRIYATNYYNLTSTVVNTRWELPADLPNGNYPVKIQNGVAEQGLSNAVLTVTDSISEVVFLTEDWMRRFRQLTNGTESTPTASGLNANRADANIVRVWDTGIPGFVSAENITYIATIIKSQNIFLGSKDWDINITVYFGNGNQATSNFLPFIGLTETTHANFTTVNALIPNTYLLEGVNQVRLKDATTGISNQNFTDKVSIYISKVGNKIFYKLFDRITMSSITYREETIDTSKNYALFFRDGYHNGWNFEKISTVNARIMN